MAFHPLERLSHLHDGYSKAFTIAGTPLLLIQDQGRRFLIANRCPHQQVPLEGSSITGGAIQCRYHGMRFDLITGQTQDGCMESLQFFPIAYDGNTLGVDL